MQIQAGDNHHLGAHSVFSEQSMSGQIQVIWSSKTFILKNHAIELQNNHQNFFIILKSSYDFVLDHIHSYPQLQ